MSSVPVPEALRPVQALLQQSQIPAALVAGVLTALVLVPLLLRSRSSRQVEGDTPLRHLPLPPTVGSKYLGFLSDDLWILLRGRLVQGQDQRFHRFGGTPYISRIFGQPLVNVYSLQHVRKLLAAEHELVEVGWMPGVQRLLGPYSVSTTLMEAHTRLRKALAPPFTQKQLERVLPAVTAIVERHMERWAKEGGVEIVKGARDATLEVMVGAMMGGFGGWVSPEEPSNGLIGRDQQQPEQQQEGVLGSARAGNGAGEGNGGDAYNAALAQCGEDLDVWLGGLFFPPIDLPGSRHLLKPHVCRT